MNCYRCNMSVYRTFIDPKASFLLIKKPPCNEQEYTPVLARMACFHLTPRQQIEQYSEEVQYATDKYE
ncbi:hypothetical protein GCM10008022_33330 [Paenibacillus hunanensis]|nr:hypothetical protein GCM10008022_33330 [Paenibacillus hunanensis]